MKKRKKIYILVSVIAVVLVVHLWLMWLSRIPEDAEFEVEVDKDSLLQPAQK